MASVLLCSSRAFSVREYCVYIVFVFSRILFSINTASSRLRLNTWLLATILVVIKPMALGHHYAQCHGTDSRWVSPDGSRPIKDTLAAQEDMGHLSVGIDSWFAMVAMSLPQLTFVWFRQGFKGFIDHLHQYVWSKRSAGLLYHRRPRSSHLVPDQH
jgi:hypothetical protein